jgi:hypothetical protein
MPLFSLRGHLVASPLASAARTPANDKCLLCIAFTMHPATARARRVLPSVCSSAEPSCPSPAGCAYKRVSPRAFCPHHRCILSTSVSHCRLPCSAPAVAIVDTLLTTSPLHHVGHRAPPCTRDPSRATRASPSSPECHYAAAALVSHSPIAALI